MKKVKIVKIVGNKEKVLDQYETIEKQDVKIIIKKLKEKGMSLQDYTDKYCHSLGYVHNICKNESNCHNLIQELKLEGIALC